MYLTTSAEGAKSAADIEPSKKIELQMGDFNDSEQFQVCENWPEEWGNGVGSGEVGVTLKLNVHRC